MNLSFADRDFYYGDPYYAPKSPMRGLLSKAYAKERSLLIQEDINNPTIQPGDPYPYQGEQNPFKQLLIDRNNQLDSSNRSILPGHDMNWNSHSQQQDLAY
jgi:gamma-glutamyltranspeptidase/glutathione hydrolase